MRATRKDYELGGENTRSGILIHDGLGEPFKARISTSVSLENENIDFNSVWVFNEDGTLHTHNIFCLYHAYIDLNEVIE